MERAHATVVERIERLAVWHRPGVAASGADSEADTDRGTLRIRTCQREVRVRLEQVPERAEGRAEIHRGSAAYRFLLQFATGLESAIPGEANVFGQVREAWRAFERDSDSAADLAPVMQALFRDVRAVRAQYLQGIGGQSYATLTRRLIGANARSRVLVVGTGALGRSMISKFTAGHIAVFNRTPPGDLPATVSCVFRPGEERAAVQWATHVILCVPRTPETDACWLPLLRARPDLRIVHLACRRDDPGGWRDIATLVDLDHVFELERRQAELRSRQLVAARAACAELAARAVYRPLI